MLFRSNTLRSFLWVNCRIKNKPLKVHQRLIKVSHKYQSKSTAIKSTERQAGSFVTYNAIHVTIETPIHFPSLPIFIPPIYITLIILLLTRLLNLFTVDTLTFIASAQDSSGISLQRSSNSSLSVCVKLQYFRK